MKISASLVLYHNNPEIFGASIQCFLDGCDGPLYVIDNSTSPLSHELFSNPRVHYIHSKNNLGFGKAHNLAITMAAPNSDLHLLLNPDITFNSNVLNSLSDFFNKHPNTGAAMPQVLYPNGELQRLCKLLPTPTNLIIRRFIPFKFIKNLIDKKYEMHNLPQDKPSSVPTLSGCFLIIKSSILLKLGGFDERYFMYMEDVDLVRRIGASFDTIYYPSVHVVHAYEKGSYKNFKLLRHHLLSAILYFNKWGWVFDKERSARNSSINYYQNF